MASSRRIVVDDTDPRIDYLGQGWFPDSASRDGMGNVVSAYKQSTHRTNRNVSFEFAFEGTSVALIGIPELTKIDKGARWDPIWECFVDQNSIGSTNSLAISAKNKVLCEKDSLSDGPHTFSINVTTAGKSIWVDYLTYTPSSRASFEGALVLVDDRDPGITLVSGWGVLGDTASMTTVKGSRAKFDFIGTNVLWVGIVPADLPHSPASGSFSIDGGPFASFEMNGLPANDTVSRYDSAFFTTPELSPGFHSLVVTYNGGDGPATPLTLDYLYVTNTSSRMSDSPSLIPAPPPTDPKSASPPVGAIIGGVIGGLALLVMVIVVSLWQIRRRTADRSGLTNGSRGSHGVTPFTSLFRSPHPHATPTPESPFDVSGSVGSSAGMSQPREMHKNRLVALPNTRSQIQNQDGARRSSKAQENVIAESVPPAYTTAV